MNTYTSHALALVLGGLIVSGGCVVLKYKQSLPSILAEPAKELAKEETRQLDCKPVLVYRDRVKEKLGMPESVKKDAKTHITASANIPASDHTHTATAVYSEETGGTNLFIRRNPLPWMAVAARYRASLYYGAGTDSESPVWLLRGDAELIQIKALHLGMTGTVDTGGRSFIGIGGEIMFK